MIFRRFAYNARCALLRAASSANLRRCGSAVPPLAALGAAAVLQGGAWTSVWRRPIAMDARGGGAITSSALVLNGQASLAGSGAKDALVGGHVGAYTTARTVDREAIFEFSMHCARIRDTALDIVQRELHGRTGVADSRERRRAAAATLAWLEAADVASMREMVGREISAALSLLRNLDPASQTEFQVTMLLTWDSVHDNTPPERGFDLHTFVQPMPQMPAMVDAIACTATRNNPTVKDVQWVKDRKQLEQRQRDAGVNELVMFGDDGGATEGLQSNFFAVSADGTVLTAPDELVLAGTVRKVVLEVCAANSIPVRKQCPDISDISSWNSCFVCSTSRLVKPIEKLGVPDKASLQTFPSSGTVAHKIEALVQEAVRRNSETV